MAVRSWLAVLGYLSVLTTQPPLVITASLRYGSSGGIPPLVPSVDCGVNAKKASWHAQKLLKNDIKPEQKAINQLYKKSMSQRQCFFSFGLIIFLKEIFW